MPVSSLRAEVDVIRRDAPIFAVVRTAEHKQAAAIAQTYLDAGLKLIEITFTVPDATDLVVSLKHSASTYGALIGMGTVTTPERVTRAIEAGADFIVSPNASASVAKPAKDAGLFLVLGALTCTEIVKASRLGADLVKVYPLPPVGGPAYLEIVRQPLGDIPMLAGGGFDIEEIPAYREAGAEAFGIGAPLLGATPEESRQRIQRALDLARPRETE